MERKYNKDGSFTFDENGRVITAILATTEQLEDWFNRGLIASLEGTCTCGQDDFCDTINHVRVRCFEDSDGVCNWHSTDDVC